MKRFATRTGDPYLLKIPPKSGAVCSQCHAIYRNKHWTLDESLFQQTQARASHVLCPACQKIHDHFALGVVHLKGDYLKAHREEILNLVHNEEGRARGRNPLERILTIREENGLMEIETTNEKLAQRIGRRLQRSHHGRVRFKWSGDDKFIRVEWERSLSEKPPQKSERRRARAGV